MNQQLQLNIGGKAWQIGYADLSITVLSILYLVGIFGLALPIHPDFVLLTPINLLISLALVLVFHPVWTRSTYLFILLCYVIGFGAELFGIQTGLLFGDYHYGPVLGPQLLGTPYMIGVNWILLAYGSGVLVNKWLNGKNKWLKALVGASIMVLLDIFIEPVAIEYDFWTWQGRNTPPLHNFVGWWIVAFLVHSIFQALQGNIKNKVGIALLILQFIFFITLNLV
jgi:putative membrane protein